MRHGKTLELPIKTIERDLCKEKNFKVESPLRLRHSLTGKLREHDVVITLNLGHRLFLTAIECKDRSRPITVEQVEAFQEKCKWTGINKGVMVSSKGFYKSAIELASKYNIDCLGFEEVESFTWLMADNLIQHKWNLRQCKWTAIPVEDKDVIPSSIKLFSKDGKELPMKILYDNACAVFKNIYLNHLKSGTGWVTLPPFSGESLLARENDTGTMIPLKVIIAEVEYVSEETLIPIKRYKYYSNSNSEDIADMAVTPIDTGEMKGNIIITYTKEGGLISFVPNDNSVS